MFRPLALTASAALVAALAACGGSAPEAGSDLERDLAAVRASAVDLAPRGSERALVVSPEEQTGAAPRRVSVAPARAAAPRRAAPQRAEARPAPGPEVAEAPAPEPEAAEPAPVAPRQEEPVVTGPLRRAPAPTATPEPPGGWRSTGEVIRNAPFPINP
jgi:hypothetical protein